MTNNTAVTTVAIAPTRRPGWAIAILETENYRTGAPVYSVVRCSPDNLYVTLTRHSSEKAARRQANIEWNLDMGRAE